MNVEKIVPCKEEEQRIVKPVTVREALAAMRGAKLAGEAELASILASPQETLEQLSLEESRSQYCPAILFCAQIHVHENGSEYVSALRMKGSTSLVIEKYWLNDPLLPSFTFAVAE